MFLKLKGPLRCADWWFRVRAVPGPASLLRSNLTIADLPGQLRTQVLPAHSHTFAGISDINQNRVRSANGYIGGCDAIILVAAIDRAKSNPWLQDSIRRCSRTSKCTLVLTKTDVFRLWILYWTFLLIATQLLSGTIDSKAIKSTIREKIEHLNNSIDREKNERAKLKAKLKGSLRKEKDSLQRRISKHE